MTKNPVSLSDMYEILFSKTRLTKMTLESPLQEFALDNSTQTLVISTPLHTLEEQQQIEKIMKACQLSSLQYKIITDEISWRLFRDQKQLKNIILFGVNEKTINLNLEIPLYIPTNFDNRIWIKSLSIDELQSNPTAKAILWKEALKPVFVDKNIQRNEKN